MPISNLKGTKKGDVMFNNLSGANMKLNGVGKGLNSLGNVSVSESPSDNEDISIMNDLSKEVDNYGDEISFSEKVEIEESSNEKNKDLTSLIDANRDGKITAQELDNYQNKDISDELDANGDGKITQQEIDNYYKKHGSNSPSVEKETKTGSDSVVKKNDYNPDGDFVPGDLFTNINHYYNTPFDATKALGIESTDELKDKSAEELYEMYKASLETFNMDMNNGRKCSILVTIFAYCDPDIISDFFDVANENGKPIQNILPYMGAMRDTFLPEHDTYDKFLYILNKYNSEFKPNDNGPSYTDGFIYA